ncbi:MAG: hypothetical protein K2H91_13755 [Lachnospiraceae bacterium]|nr:hypothetical protein [Lachnospiraceae bacterium]
MVQVICRDGKFLVKGTFDMGIAGFYENKDFGDKVIQIDNSLDDMIKGLDEKNYMWMNPLKPIFEKVPRDGDSLAKAFEDYINEKEIMVQKNRKQMNDYFLYRLISFFVDCAYPFWENENAILPEYKHYQEEDFEKIYKDDKLDVIYDLCDEFDDAPNNGSVKKTDVEALAKKLFPMFDFDGLIKSIDPGVVGFNGSWMIVEFSDGWGGLDFYCSAYEEFDENLAPRDWHNF